MYYCIISVQSVGSEGRKNEFQKKFFPGYMHACMYICMYVGPLKTIHTCYWYGINIKPTVYGSLTCNKMMIRHKTLKMLKLS